MPRLCLTQDRQRASGTRPPRHLKDRAKARQRTSRPHEVMRRSRRNDPPLRRLAHLWHPLPGPHQHSPRHRPHRLRIPTRDTTCSRWPITTWKTCDPALCHAVGVTRRNRLHAIAMKKFEYLERTAPPPPKSCGSQVPPGSFRNPAPEPTPTRGVPSAGGRSPCAHATDRVDRATNCISA